MRSALLKLLLMISIGFSVQAGTKTWNNASGGNWGAASNWVENAVPGAGDTVYITLDGNYTVTYNANYTFPSVIYLGGSSGIQTLYNPGNVFGVTGTITVNTNGVLWGIAGTYSATSVINNGTIRLTNGSFTFGAPIINNDSIYVAGTTITLSGSLTNNDSIYVATGTLRLSGGGASVGGDIVVASGSTLQLNTGTFTYDASSTITGSGNVDFSGATVTYTGTYNIGGTTSVSSTVTFNGSSGSIQNIGSQLTVTSGTLTLSTTDSVIFGNLTQSGGTITGNCPLRITNAWSWSGGTLSGTDSTVAAIVSETATLTMSGASSRTLSRRTLINRNIFKNTGTASLAMSNGSILINQYQIDLAGANVGFSYSSGSKPRIENNRFFTKTGSGNSIVDVKIIHTSAYTSAWQGTLTFSDSSIWINSVDSSRNHAMTVFSTGSHTFDAGSSLYGRGDVGYGGGFRFVSGTTTIYGYYEVDSLTEVQGGTVNFVGTSGKLKSVGDSLFVSGGTTNFLTGDSIIVQKITQSGGTMHGNSPLRVSHAWAWNGGTLSGTDSTITAELSGNAVLTLSNASTRTLSRRTLILAYSSSLIHNSTASMTMSNGALLVNQAGLIEMRQNAGFSYGTGFRPRLKNINGSMIKTSGVGTSTITVMVENTDAFIGALTGTIAMTDSTRWVNSSDSTGSGSTISLDNGSHTFDAGSRIVGSGTFSFDGGTVTISGYYNNTYLTRVAGAAVTLSSALGKFISAGDSIYVSSGTLNFLNPDTIKVKNLALAGGTITGSTPLHVYNSLNWTGGTLSGTDSALTLTTGSSALINISGSGAKTLSRRTLINSYTLTHTGTSFTHSNGAIMINQTGAAINLAGNNSGFSFGTGAKPRIKNYGLIAKTAGTGSTIDIVLENYDARVETQTTSLTFSDTTKWFNSTDTLHTGTSNSFTTLAHTFDSNSRLVGTGSVSFTSGSMAFGGIYDIGAVSTFSGSAVSIAGSGGSLLKLGDSVSVTGGTINISTPQRITIRSLRQSGGTLNLTMNDTLQLDTLIQSGGAVITGNSPIRVTDWFNWAGGTQSATDSTVATIIQTSALFNTGTRTLSKRTLINQGTITWTLGHWDNNTGAIIRNESGALIDVTAAGYYINYFGSAPAPKFINNGIFRVSSGGSITYLNVDAVNTNASYQIQSGTLQVSANATNVNTPWTLSNNRFLLLTGGTQTWDATSPISGTGTVRFTNGTHTINGLYNISDSTDASATVTFNGSVPSVGPYLGISGNTIFNNKDSLILSRLTMQSSTATFNTNDSIIIDRMVQTGGIITGNSPMRVKTRYDWSAGYIYGSDSTVAFINSGVINITTNTRQVQKRTFINEGTINWSAGHWDWDFGAIFINRPGALINITSDWWWNNYPNSGSDPMIYNYGTIRKSAGTGVSVINISRYDSNATIEAQAGTLAFGNTTSHVMNYKNTDVSLSSGARLRFSGGTHTIDSASSISGSGTLDFSAGTVNILAAYSDIDSTTITGGTVNLNQADTVKFGVLRLDGNGVLGGSAPIVVSNRFSFAQGTISGTDSTLAFVVRPGAQFFSYGGNNVISKRTFENHTNVIWTAGNWYLSNGAIFNNKASGVFDAQNNYIFYQGSGSTPIFQNYGTIRKSAGGSASYWYVPTNSWNGSKIEIKNGSFITAGTWNATGTILTIDSAATWQPDGGGIQQRYDSSCTIQGKGNIISPTFSSPQLFIKGYVNMTDGSLTLNDGIYYFDGPAGRMISLPKRIYVGNGDLYFSGADTVRIKYLRTTGGLGFVDGSSPIITDTLDIAGGPIKGTSTSSVLIIPANGVFYWSNTGDIYSRRVYNYGTSYWSNPWGFSQSAVYYNMTGAVTYLTTDANSNWFFGTTKPYFINYGLLHKSGGTGVSSFEYQISNYGTIRVDSGLTIQTGDSLVNFSTGIITGKGTLDVGSYFDNYGTIRPGASPGKLRITGNINNRSTAVYDAEISGKNFGQFDELRASGAATLAGTVNVSLLNGFLPTLGDTIKIMNYGSKTGGFGAIQGLRTGGQYDFVPVYRDTALLLVTADSSNTPPVAVNDVVTASEDVASTLSVLRNDTDTNGDALRIIEILPGFPYHGTAVNGTGDTTLIYTSASEYSGSDSLQYVVADGRGGLDTAAVKITVNSVNDRPDAKDTSVVATQYGIVRVNVLATATDIENQALTVSAVSRPKFGDAHVDGTSSSVVYIPSVNYTGVDSFKFYVSDGSLADSAAMFVTVSSGDTFLITWSNFESGMENWSTVNDVSDSAFRPAGGNPGGYFTATDAVTGSWWYFNAPSKFLGDLSSVYNKTFRYDIKQNPVGGDNSQPDVILIGNGVQLNYDFPTNPRSTFTSFGLVFNESAGWKKTNGVVPTKTELENVLANVTALRIRGEYTSGTDSAGLDNVILEKALGNSNPVTSIDNVSVNEENSVTVSVLTNDTDPENHTLHIASITQPNHGTANINSGNLTITYDPDSNFAGIDTVMYYAADNYGGQSMGYLKITVNNVNDAPYVATVIADTTLTEDFGKRFIGMMTNIFNDVDNGPTYGATNLTIGVTPFISNDSLYVLSSSYFNGTVSIALSANDGEYVAADTFNVTVSGVNNAPFVMLSARDTAFTEDFGRTFVGLLTDVFSDADGDSIVFGSNVLSGSVLSQTNGDSLFITGGANYYGTAVIRVFANDGQFTVSDTFAVTVTPVNDPVVQSAALSNQTLMEDFGKTPLKYLPNYFTDADNASLTFAVSVLSGNILTSISGDTLYAESEIGFLGDAFVRVAASDTQYTVADTFTVSVIPFNYTPTLVQSLRDTSLTEDAGKTFLTVLNSYFTDVESSTLVYSSQLLSGSGSATITNDSLYLQTVQDFYGNVSIRITASDGALSVSDTFNVAVSNINDAPRVIAHIADITKTVDFGKAYVEKRATIFSDPENDALTMTATALQAGVNAEVSGDSIYILSTGGFIGNVGVRATVSDGEYTASDTFYVTVNPANFPPVLSQNLRDTTLAEDFGKTWVYKLTSYFNDVDDANLNYSSNILSSGVSVVVSQDSLYLTGSADFNGTAVVRVQAQDSYNNVVADTFNVIVTPVNDAPYRIRIIADIDVAQNFGKVFADKLSAVFGDIDNGVLNYAVTTLNAGVNGLIQNDTLYLISTTGFTGASTLRVTASDGEYTVADTLIVNVFSNNHAPVLAQALRDTSLNEDFGRIRHSVLSQFFTDSDLNALTYTVTAGVGVLANVQNDTLYLTSTSQFSGMASVIVSASDGLAAISDTFIVTVNSVNDAPSSFALVAPADNALLTTLRPVFTWRKPVDPDGDALTYTIEISTSNTFTSTVVNASASDTTYTPTTDLDSTQAYFWRITAHDGHSGNTVSAVRGFSTDAKRPALSLWFNQGPILKSYMDLQVYSSETLSGTVQAQVTMKNSSNTVTDNRTLSLDRVGIGTLYTGKYQMNSGGSLTVVVNAQDAAGNTRSIQRVYQVAAISKNQTLALKSTSAYLSSGSRMKASDGFIMMVENTSEELSEMAVSASVNIHGTTEITDALMLAIRLDKSMLTQASMQSGFDARQIGIYRKTDMGYEYVGGQSDGYDVRAKVTQYGSYVALYRTGHIIVPDRLELAQNYPNPFNPTTTIEFGLTENGYVKIAVYNLLGQLVKTLVDEKRDAGYHKVMWDGRNSAGQISASGIYIYRLETKSGVVARKMTLIK